MYSCYWNIALKRCVEETGACASVGKLQRQGWLVTCASWTFSTSHRSDTSAMDSDSSRRCRFRQRWRPDTAGVANMALYYLKKIRWLLEDIWTRYVPSTSFSLSAFISSICWFVNEMAILVCCNFTLWGISAETHVHVISRSGVVISITNCYIRVYFTYFEQGTVRWLILDSSHHIASLWGRYSC